MAHGALLRAGPDLLKMHIHHIIPLGTAPLDHPFKLDDSPDERGDVQRLLPTVRPRTRAAPCRTAASQMRIGFRANDIDQVLRGRLQEREFGPGARTARGLNQNVKQFRQPVQNPRSPVRDGRSYPALSQLVAEEAGHHLTLNDIGVTGCNWVAHVISVKPYC